MKSIYDTIKELLIARGWSFDPNAKENGYGEVKDFIHPETNKRMTFIDAIFNQEDIEIKLGLAKDRE